MPILTNITKVYLNADRTKKDVINPFISSGANFTTPILLVAPFSIHNSHYVNFKLENLVQVPTRYLMLIGYETSEDTNNEQWGVWRYDIGSAILAAAVSSGKNNRPNELLISFSEYANVTDDDIYDFIGFYSSLSTLNSLYPAPLDNLYAGVGNGTTMGTATCYLAVGGVWVSQSKTVFQFESDEGILRESFIGESVKIPLSIDPNISTIVDEVDNTNLDIIFKNISNLNGEVLDIKTFLDTLENVYVKQILPYDELISVPNEAYLYLYSGGVEKKTTKATLLIEERDRLDIVESDIEQLELKNIEQDGRLDDYDNHITNTANPHQTTLSNLGDPTASKTFNMGGNTITFRFTNPNGGMLFDMTGGWSGHIFEILDTVAQGTGALHDHLSHFETNRVNVVPVHAVNTQPGARALLVDGDSHLNGDIKMRTQSLTDLFDLEGDL
jgi:hypothetical protein